jgi:hypothetical protein
MEYSEGDADAQLKLIRDEALSGKVAKQPIFLNGTVRTLAGNDSVRVDGFPSAESRPDVRHEGLAVEPIPACQHGRLAKEMIRQSRRERSAAWNDGEGIAGQCGGGGWCVGQESISGRNSREGQGGENATYYDGSHSPTHVRHYYVHDQ